MLSSRNMWIKKQLPARHQLYISEYIPSPNQSKGGITDEEAAYHRGTKNPYYKDDMFTSKNPEEANKIIPDIKTHSRSQITSTSASNDHTPSTIENSDISLSHSDEPETPLFLNLICCLIASAAVTCIMMFALCKPDLFLTNKSRVNLLKIRETAAKIAQKCSAASR